MDIIIYLTLFASFLLVFQHYFNFAKRLEQAEKDIEVLLTILNKESQETIEYDK